LKGIVLCGGGGADVSPSAPQPLPSRSEKATAQARRIESGGPYESEDDPDGSFERSD
jgi:hypothetical protein